MIAVQSIWFNELNDGIDYSCGWLDVRFHLFSWTLSSLLLARHFDTCSLVSDEKGTQLVERLQLPYTRISTELESIKRINFLWMPNKVYSYSIQQEPFVHVDIDAYLFNNLDEKLKNAPLFAQNFEYDLDTYVEAYEDIHTYFSYIPEFIKKDALGRLTAVNAGIIGGNNTQFFNELINVLNDFLEKNDAHIRKCRYTPLNIFAEQFLFKNYADAKNIPIDYLTPREFGPPCDYQMADFVQLPNDNAYVHLMNYKRNPTACEQLAQRLWLESPELYERVITVCRELAATHHYVETSEAPKQPRPFYRTLYALQTLGLIQSDSSIAVKDVAKLIENLPDGPHKDRLIDVWQYESSRQAYVQDLPEISANWQKWRYSSNQVNTLLAQPAATYRQAVVRRSDRCVRIESEWNWVEANEFAGQTADRGLYDNLQTEPAYFEVLLYYYPHQKLVREQLLDVLNILVLDTLEEPLSIEKLIESVAAQVLSYQLQANLAELSATLLGQIRHFLYHGILEPVL
ncbi:DUF6734 family protein [Spirosoma flavum]|uniref:DUF6734 family protein n=1 Tax=Spirosoma flavum TaxID=2048557 RepID=A0ABW6ATG3_9BACT